MKKLDALKDLAKQVEAGDEFMIERAIQDAFGSYRNSEKSYHTYKACFGSLDAAKALHEAVLTHERWEWRVSYLGAVVAFDGLDGYAEFVVDDRDNPARAWLLCILQALIAQEETP